MIFNNILRVCSAFKRANCVQVRHARRTRQPKDGAKIIREPHTDQPEQSSQPEVNPTRHPRYKLMKGDIERIYLQGLPRVIPKDGDQFDRDFMDMKVEDFEELYRDDKTGNIEKQISGILSEYEDIKYNNLGRVPLSLSMQNMVELLRVKNREKYIEFLYKRERLKNKPKRPILDKQYAEGGPRTGLLDSNGNLIYGLWHNSLFCRVSGVRLKNGNSLNRLLQAATFGRKLAFDCSYERLMDIQRLTNCIEQFAESYGLNRFHYREPFDLWLSNYVPGSETDHLIKRCIGLKHPSTMMISTVPDDITNHFDRSKLVYLSPDAKYELTDPLENDDIYIIGMLNDIGVKGPVSLRRAEQLQIRAKRLPIDSHVAWGSGTKNLCLNHVTGVLLEVMSNGGDWRKAFLKHIPKRKLKSHDQLAEEYQRREKKRSLYNWRPYA